jgi:hypothetical protein
MFVGHLAAALGAKKVTPELPLGVAVGASFGLDLLWPLLLLSGVETVRLSPGDTAFTQLAFESYPWSHSLLMVVVWSALAASLAARIWRSWRIGSVVGLLVASHWLLDVVAHRPDLPLWPGGPLVGLGLWYSIPGTLVLEGMLLGIGVWLYTRATTARDRTGRLAFYSLVGLCTVIWATQPWTPLPTTASAVAWGALVGWLLPPWGQWADRHRQARVWTSDVHHDS